MNKIKISRILPMTFIGMFAMSVATSCTSGFDEANRPGENASYDELARDNYNTGAFLVQLQNAAFPEQENDYQMTQDLIGNTLGRFMTYANDGFSASNFAKMNAPLGWVRYPFAQTTPKVVSAFNEVAKITKNDGMGYAWALILRAQAFLRLTDMYGPMTIGAEDNPNAYSSQEKIYKSLIGDLNTATEILKNLIDRNDGKLVGYQMFDNVYSGNFNKWYVFANSLKLRMAIRMREVEPVFAREVGEAAVKAGVKTTNADNCAIAFNPNGLYKVSIEWGDTRACADLESYMTGYNDKRIEKYFKPVETTGGRVYIGCRAAADVKNKKVAGKLYSAINVQKNDRGVWMTAAEMTFCRAEGALFNWEMNGNAGDLYNQAIKLSFEQWGVSGAEDYYNNQYLTPASYTDAEGGYGTDFSPLSDITVKWEQGGDEKKNLERLIVQKWIALFPDGQEAWNEIRRTGYPVVSELAQSAEFSLRVPNRLPFDYQEKVNNPENYAKAVELLGGGSDDYATKMWWQKNK